MSDALLIKDWNGNPIQAVEGDCVFDTRVGTRYAPVMHQVAGCVTARRGELCVVVEATK